MKIFLRSLSQISICLFLLIQLGCGDDESALNISDITVDADKTTVLLGESIVLIAKNQGGIDITDNVTFFEGATELQGNVYKPENTGDFYLKAQYLDIKSTLLNVIVIENITELNFSAVRAPIKPIGTDTCYFKITNQIGIDVTSLVDIYKGSKRYFSEYYFSSDEESVEFSAEFYGVNSNTFTLDVALNPVELHLNSIKDFFDGNGNVSPVFIVLDEDQDTITEFVSLYNEGVILAKNQFTTSVLGEYNFIAKYKDVESNVLTLSAVPRKSRKVLIEEFTGEWCGWCPMAAYNIEKLIDERNGNVLTAAIHNGDDLAYENEGLLRSAFGINYFPSGVIGRSYLGDQVGFNDPTLNQKIINLADNEINVEEILLGVVITTSLNSNKVLVDVNVNFYVDISNEMRITIYLIENNVVSGEQQNYFAGYPGYEGSYYYDQPAVISNYLHQNVLRKVSTDVYGEVIPSSDTKINNTFSFPQNEIDVTGYDPANTYVIAFVHYPLAGETKKILNAEQVRVGENSLGK